MLDLEKLQLAKQGKGTEEFEAKSLISVIEENPKRIKDLFILNLNSFEEQLINKNKDYWKIALLKGANNNNFSYITKCLGIIFNEKNFGINDEGIIEICLLYICKNMEMDKILQLLNNCENKIGIDTVIDDSIENRNELFKLLLNKINEKIENKEEKEELLKKCFKKLAEDNKNIEMFKILLEDNCITEDKELIKDVFYSCYTKKYFKLIKELFNNENINTKYFSKFKFHDFIKNLKEFEYFIELFDTNAVKNNVLLFSRMLFRLISIYTDKDSELNKREYSKKISDCYTDLIMKKMPEIKQEDKVEYLVDTIANCIYHILTDNNLSEENWREVIKILTNELNEKDIIDNYFDIAEIYNNNKPKSFNLLNEILYSCDIELIKSLIESGKINLNSKKTMNHITDCICNLEQDKQEERKELINLVCESNKKLLILIHSKLESYKEQLETNEKYKAILGALEEYKQNDLLPSLTNDFLDNLNECLNECLDYADFTEKNTIQNNFQ